MMKGRDGAAGKDGTQVRQKQIPSAENNAIWHKTKPK